jgi:hypothetical protein
MLATHPFATAAVERWDVVVVVSWVISSNLSKFSVVLRDEQHHIQQ